MTITLDKAMLMLQTRVLAMDGEADRILDRAAEAVMKGNLGKAKKLTAEFAALTTNARTMQASLGRRLIERYSDESLVPVPLPDDGCDGC